MTWLDGAGRGHLRLPITPYVVDRAKKLCVGFSIVRRRCCHEPTGDARRNGRARFDGYTRGAVTRFAEAAGWGARTARDLLVFDAELARARELPLADRVRLWAARYRAIAGGASELPYLGRTLHYDSRLMPALMPAYLTEIRRLDRTVGLSAATVIDIGANIGQFAATISWRFPQARVWSFEPNHEIYPLLARNAAQATNWRTAPWGIAASDEELSLYSVRGKSSQGSLYPSNATVGLLGVEASEHRVSVRRLTPELMAQLEIPERVDLLKIDVEGAEDTALAGSACVHWRYLMIELSPDRDGGLSLAGAMAFIERTWGRRPDVVWTGGTTIDGQAREAILKL